MPTRRRSGTPEGVPDVCMLTSALARNRKTVCDREHHRFDPFIVGHEIVNRADGPGVFALVILIEYRAPPQDVVEQDQTVLTKPLNDLLIVIAVVSLVGVDKGNVEAVPLRKRAQGFESRSDFESDLVRDSRFFPVASCNGRPFLVHVAT